MRSRLHYRALNESRSRGVAGADLDHNAWHRYAGKGGQISCG